MKFLTVQEVSTMLRVSDDTILNLIKSSQLPATKVGGQWRVTEKALQEYINKRSTKALKDIKFLRP